MKKIAVFPGSFDPVTRGHESIIIRGVPLFDELIVAIGENTTKQTLFPIEKRMEWLKKVFTDYPSIKVMRYKGLTVKFCKEVGAGFILRGLRTSADFEFERSIGQTNKKLHPEIETVFLLSSPEYTSLNSSIVKDIFVHGGDPSQFVPDGIDLNN